MSIYYVQTVPPLALIKKRCQTEKETIECLQQIIRKTEEYRKDLTDEYLNSRKLSRFTCWDELNKHTEVTKISKENWKDKECELIWTESEFENPYTKEELKEVEEEENV